MVQKACHHHSRQTTWPPCPAHPTQEIETWAQGSIQALSWKYYVLGQYYRVFRNSSQASSHQIITTLWHAPWPWKTSQIPHFKVPILYHSSEVKWKSLTQVTHSCLTLCNPMDCILQARILEWVAIPFSRGSSQPRDQTQVSHIAGGFFTSWATREAHIIALLTYIIALLWKPAKGLLRGELLNSTQCWKTLWVCKTNRNVSILGKRS